MAIDFTLSTCNKIYPLISVLQLFINIFLCSRITHLLKSGNMNLKSLPWPLGGISTTLPTIQRTKVQERLSSSSFRCIYCSLWNKYQILFFESSAECKLEMFRFSGLLSASDLFLRKVGNWELRYSFVASRHLRIDIWHLKSENWNIHLLPAAIWQGDCLLSWDNWIASRLKLDL